MSHTLDFSQVPHFFRRHPAFFRVFLADALSQLGQGMLLVAFPMFILEVTHDVSLTGLAFSGEIAAYGLLSPVAGYWADRMEQKVLMLLANLGRIAMLLSLLHVLHHGGTLGVCLLLSVALGAAGALFVPARAAFLRRLLSGEDLLQAVALEGTCGFLLRLVAPALMGIILIVYPATAGIWLNIFIYCVSSALILPAWVSGPRVPSSSDDPDPGGWQAGWQHILANPTLRTLLALDVCLSLVGMAAWSTTVAFIEIVLHQPAAYNGFLVGATGLAGAFGTRLGTRLGHRRSTYLGLMAVVTLSYLSVPQVHWLGGLVAIWMARGLSVGIFVVLVSQQLALLTPPDRMGRVQAAWEMSACGAAFLGSLSTPWLLRHVGPAGSFQLFAALTGTLVLLGLLNGRRS